MSGRTIRLERTRVEAREIDGEIVIYDLSERRYFGGNRVATALWPMLVEGTDREALGERLRSLYGLADDRAREDAGAFVDSLLALGLVTESAA